MSTISHNNPLFAQRIEAIAREICPATTNSGLRQQALIVGECTTILICVQAQRIALTERLRGGEPAPPRDELEAMSFAARDLDRLERYERQALSRRKRAIETFMAINHMP